MFAPGLVISPGPQHLESCGGGPFSPACRLDAGGSLGYGWCSAHNQQCSLSSARGSNSPASTPFSPRLCALTRAARRRGCKPDEARHLEARRGREDVEPERRLDHELLRIRAPQDRLGRSDTHVEHGPDPSTATARDCCQVPRPPWKRKAEMTKRPAIASPSVYPRWMSGGCSRPVLEWCVLPA